MIELDDIIRTGQRKISAHIEQQNYEHAFYHLRSRIIERKKYYFFGPTVYELHGMNIRQTYEKRPTDEQIWNFIIDDRGQPLYDTTTIPEQRL